MLTLIIWVRQIPQFLIMGLYQSNITGSYLPSITLYLYLSCATVKHQLPSIHLFNPTMHTKQLPNHYTYVTMRIISKLEVACRFLVFGFCLYTLSDIYKVVNILCLSFVFSLCLRCILPYKSALVLHSQWQQSFKSGLFILTRKSFHTSRLQMNSTLQYTSGTCMDLDL